MARSSPTTPSYSQEPRPLGVTRRGGKGAPRNKRVSSSSSSLSMDAMAALSNSVPGSTLEPAVDESGIRYRSVESTSVPSSKPDDDSTTAKFPNSSSVVVMPSAGLKLGHMLSLIRQEDVEFKHYPYFTRVYFPSKNIGEPRLMHHLKARRLRDLISLAVHLDEEDRFLKIPSLALPHSLQPSKPSICLEKNISAVPST